MNGIIEYIGKLEVLALFITAYLLTLDHCYDFIVENVTRPELVVFGTGVLIVCLLHKKLKI